MLLVDTWDYLTVQFFGVKYCGRCGREGSERVNQTDGQ